jgi:transposase
VTNDALIAGVWGAPKFPDSDLIRSVRKEGVSADAMSQRRYTPEFKQEAARLVVESGRPIAQVARELGISDQTLGPWVQKYRRDHEMDELPTILDDRTRLQELERRNRELAMENEFLKKCAAYFARDVR